MAKYELLGTTEGRVRILLGGNSVESLRADARRWNMTHWAIYRTFVKGRKFHNATDESFLVEHHNDPYWLNRGVESGAKKEAASV